MKLTATCPSCGAELELEDIAPGTEFACPGCGAPCTAPGADPPAPRMRRQLRIPARRDTAPPPVNVTVQQQRQPVLLAAIRGCLILLAMAVILALVVTGCNLLGLFGVAHVAQKTADALVATMPGTHIAKTAGAPSSESVADDAPAWQTTILTDAMTDARTLRAALRENNPPTGLLERPATLVLDLNERGGIGVGALGVDDLSLLGPVEVDVRWDETPAETIPWRWMSGTGTCLRGGRELYDRIRRARRLRIRVPIPGGSWRDAEFSLGGLAAALDRADPDRTIRAAAERVQADRMAWSTVRETDGSVVLGKRARDEWGSVASVGPVTLHVALRADGSVSLVAIHPGDPMIVGGRWRTRVGANPAALEPWRVVESGTWAAYGGDPAELVRRMERARTLYVEVHAGLQTVGVEWRLDGLADALAAARAGVADL